MTVLVIVEAPGQIDKLLPLCNGRPYRLVTVGPHASLELTARGLPFDTAENLTSEDALNALGIDILRLSDRFARQASEILQAEIPVFRQHGYFGPWFIQRKVSLVCHFVQGKACEMHHVLDNLSPEEVIFGLSEPDDGTDELPYFVSLYGQVLRLLCESRGISYQTVPLDLRVSLPCHADLPLEKTMVVPQARNLAWLADGIKRRLIRLVGEPLTRLLSKMRRSRPRLFVMGEIGAEQYLSSATELLTPTGLSEHQVTPALEIVDELMRCWPKLRELPVYRRLYHQKSVDLRPIVENRMQKLLVDRLARLYKVFTTAVDSIHSLRPKALVAGDLGDLAVKMVAHAALRHGLPVFGRPHGTLGICVLPGMHYEELILATDYFIGCIGQQRFVDRQSDVPIRCHLTGNADLEKISRLRSKRARALRALGFDPSKPTVLLPIPATDGNTRYYPFLSVSDERKTCTERRILEVLAEHPSLQVIVKGHPGRLVTAWPLIDWCREQFGNRFRYLWNGSFTSMLDWVDTFIITHAMTTIIQAMTRPCQIYCFNENLAIYDDAKELMQKDIVFSEDMDWFCHRLRQDIASGQAFLPRRDSGRFFDTYVQGFTDGKSGLRMAQHILSMVRQQQHDGPASQDLVAFKMSGGPFFDEMRRFLDNPNFSGLDEGRTWS